MCESVRVCVCVCGVTCQCYCPLTVEIGAQYRETSAKTGYNIGEQWYQQSSSWSVLILVLESTFTITCTVRTSTNSPILYTVLCWLVVPKRYIGNQQLVDIAMSTVLLCIRQPNLIKIKNHCPFMLFPVNSS